LPATALVHEAFFRLVDVDVAWQNRAHFFAIAARVLRRVLVEHAKTRNRQKRGGGLQNVPLDEALMLGPDASEIVTDLDEALSRLALQDERKCDVIQLMFFGGLTYDEVAEALGISPATVHRELRLGKAWLHREMTHGSI
jgi:RNA polymerase sigma factor (TIGR02999 family)